MSRDVDLNALKAGINRLRTKGGADPSSLYDLVNGYVTIDGSIVSRPGTVSEAMLPAGTKGLCAFAGKLLVFSHQATPISTPGFACMVLSNPNDATQPIKEIHFAAPFMGAPYVAAEFDNGEVHHYWLQSGGAWKANTVYREGDVVEPTVPNGLAYRATGSNHPEAWRPNTQYTVGDVVQPTVANGYQYTLVEVAGEAPASGATEPDWLTSEGALVYEDIDSTPQPTQPTGGSSTPNSDRYGNLPGYKQDQLGALEK